MSFSRQFVPLIKVTVSFRQDLLGFNIKQLFMLQQRLSKSREHFLKHG